MLRTDTFWSLEAIQGSSGLWFKPGYDESGRKHLLVSETRHGVECGDHDHYWTQDAGDSDIGMQIRNRGSIHAINKKGHLLPAETSFPALALGEVKSLFWRWEWFKPVLELIPEEKREKILAERGRALMRQCKVVFPDLSGRG